ncbi:hypothetical protein GGR44_002520 [Sphingobium fontiphilum]|uniref:PD-(D/E)XK nuclease superfamily protein n=1 Tax=Sphingobium fontiphilum TaxID=944425 RepID=A0A7W6DGG1_9SPHN|nr:PD-(D/E)XK nuclease family protein [Sphingobium fontiphilum]MBB3982840.1 hypothetical protein [Sphingobium fontiphilum]
MSEEFIPTLTHATERDIDLLIVEELYASDHFVGWIAQRAGIQGKISSSVVLHSKRRTRNRREIDIFCELKINDGSEAAILIENKLDALEQRDQAESYREELAVHANKYANQAMLIICPAAYVAQHRVFTGKFDATVTYEELAQYFRSREEMSDEQSRRYRFRRELIEQAINKARRGYEPVPNQVIGDFNAMYCSMLEQAAPEIIPGPSMRKPANPDESVSMIFDAAASFASLPSDLRPRRFAHELGKGQSHRANYVAVTFANWGPALSALRELFQADAQDIGATFATKPPSKRTPQPGLVMSCPTPAADNQTDFAEQTAVILAGMTAADTLRRWLLDNQNILRKWKAAVEKELAR